MTAEQAVEAFVAVADELCRRIESAGEEPVEELVTRSASLLSLLYASALALPATEPGVEDLSELHRAEPSRWPEIHTRLTGALGEASGYWEVVDPHEAEEPVVCSIADDLTEIYRGVRPMLDLLHAGGPPERALAIWQLRFDFHYHWGDRVVDSLRALHRLVSRIRAREG